MDHSLRGSFRLFRAAGIDVYLHWSWFLIALILVTSRRPDGMEYQAPAWKVAEFVSVFVFVLLHEFGHALACRSVGGKAETILLWPLGGVAFVAPPPRPGAFLWSIAAGPLVNFLLLIPTFALWSYASSQGWAQSQPDIYRFLGLATVMNAALFGFNILPIYPLDGGQMVQAFLWYGVGRYESLRIVSLFGMIVGGLLLLGSLVVLPLIEGWALITGLLALTITLRSFVSFKQAEAILTVQALPRNSSVRCPSCHTAPPQGSFWVCDHCQTRFDLFDHRGKCPACGAWYLEPSCPHCFETSHIDQWTSTAPAPLNEQP
ncbi:MAG: M50 family metallopeptidase [Gemmataceae bacterium]